MGILMNCPSLQAFPAVKGWLFTSLSTAGVDICEKRFKTVGLAQNPQSGAGAGLIFGIEADLHPARFFASQVHEFVHQRIAFVVAAKQLDL